MINNCHKNALKSWFNEMSEKKPYRCWNWKHLQLILETSTSKNVKYDETKISRKICYQNSSAHLSLLCDAAMRRCNSDVNGYRWAKSVFNSNSFCKQFLLNFKRNFFHRGCCYFIAIYRGYIPNSRLALSSRPCLYIFLIYCKWICLRA